LNILLALTAAVISYYAVEQPFLRLRERLEKPAAPTPPLTEMLSELR
jgi:hypothetical protein